MRACTSSNSRTFSIAITAWSAKVVDQLDLLVGEGADSWSAISDDHADRVSFTQERDREHGAIAAYAYGPQGQVYSGSAENIGNMNDRPSMSFATQRDSRPVPLHGGTRMVFMNSRNSAREADIRVAQ